MKYRIKFSTGMALLCVILGIVGKVTAEVWDGQTFDKYSVTYSYSGYVEEYTNGDEFCHSWILPPGFSLLHWLFLAVVYGVLLIYIFLGVAIVSDIFME